MCLQGSKATGLHLLKFRDFSMVLSYSQLEMLASTLGVDETNAKALATYFQEALPDRLSRFMADVMRRPLNTNKALRLQPCTWNMFLSRRCVSCQQHWGYAGMKSCPTSLLETKLSNLTYRTKSFQILFSTRHL